ncbi:hypothetical protein Ppa06_37170 [Planomonospora parontospora subsp. parontospora]|uniref:Uncharacterized protein n=2 Tax=Planomonospora parontospora TaxID=58119 RepID=A0AA37F4W8_9ACTN|nr:hypothetical protein [Planomonospora parontospora]GGK69603.1 hypothetical protein GCM10010126_31270 [Planomonospora parontospora]GII09919.1 hypothetical protein Ppa06_37170 [Planomonospora parontospora subsp. parontospora]
MAAITCAISLADLRLMLDSLEPEDYSGRRSAASAFIETATGMGSRATGRIGPSGEH